MDGIARAVTSIQSSEQYSPGQIQRFNDVLNGCIIHTAPKTLKEFGNRWGITYARVKQIELKWPGAGPKLFGVVERFHRPSSPKRMPLASRTQPLREELGRSPFWTSTAGSPS
jgi:hypothetical protein